MMGWLRYVCMYVYMCVCIYIYIYTHTHTYIRKYPHTNINTCTNIRTYTSYVHNVHIHNFVPKGRHTYTHTQSHIMNVHVCAYTHTHIQCIKITNFRSNIYTCTHTCKPHKHRKQHTRIHTHMHAHAQITKHINITNIESTTHTHIHTHTNYKTSGGKQQKKQRLAAKRVQAAGVRSAEDAEEDRQTSSKPSWLAEGADSGFMGNLDSLILGTSSVCDVCVYVYVGMCVCVCVCGTHSLSHTQRESRTHS
jgi:hypothetical protein